MKAIPSLFVSYELPPLALQDDPYNTSLVNFGRYLGSSLKGIVCVSSQWTTPGPVQITTMAQSSIQYNFQGFQQELYEMTYEPPVSFELEAIVAELLEKQNFETTYNEHYGFDHGVWMPLRLIRPEADIPVVQISIPMIDDPRMLLKLGHALSSLREQGILVLGSGAAALNTGKLVWHARGEDIHPKSKEFNQWLEEKLMSADIENILDYRKAAPHSDFANPTSAGLMPLIFIMGTSIAGDRPQIVYKGFKYSTASLLSVCLSEDSIPEGLLS
ncbi:DODA-type extradiol aromatic ring-opening family dioxygenase [Peredibacter starrii]|uniref:Class III extradiol ring-cleavage dioxygenase n=1 Tax=Peredibacter starrii TaxID=28202 RepID=A0AAX4HLR8_9BACT|nr:class III extradiol ring-cleavage dioxygenase [Peredibacter starrii]WPU64156.1 class III extradiol ring-cleavage dioxygenase [Peredibacter starrii]